MKNLIVFILFSISSFLTVSQDRVKLYINVIQCSGQQSATEEIVDNMLCELSTGFNGIVSFSWDGTIAYRSDPEVCDNKTIWTMQVSQYNQSDGVNIYILGDHESGGLGNTVDRVIRIGSGIRNPESVQVDQTQLITHEMGHVFGLAHTSDDPNECNDPRNMMCESNGNHTCGSGCGSFTQWDYFSQGQKNTMQAYLNARPELFTSQTGEEFCAVDPPQCNTPNANNISFVTAPFGFGNWWVTRGYYNGASTGYTWEWELTSGNDWGAGGAGHWIMWEDNVGGVDLRVRVTNSCGSTSAWKSYSR